MLSQSSLYSSNIQAKKQLSTYFSSRWFPQTLILFLMEAQIIVPRRNIFNLSAGTAREITEE